MFQGLGSHQPHDLRVIVRLAEMPQDQLRGHGAQIPQQIVGYHEIRKVSHATHHTLLHGPWIRAYLQHIQIVVGLEHQQVGSPQVILDGLRDVAKIGGKAQPHALCLETKADRVNGVVGDAEALDRNIANRETGACLEGLQARTRFPPVDGRHGEARHVNGGAHVAIPSQHRQTRHVVGVLVGDEEGVDLGKILADGRQAFPEFPHAEAGVHQNPCFPGGHQNGVARTPAGQNAELYDEEPPRTNRIH